MRKGVKFLLSALFIGMIILTSAIYFISTKIDPETIKKYSIASIEKYLPGVKAQIKLVDYELGTSLSVEVKEIVLNDRLDSSKLLELKNITIRIPILAILTSGGIIDISTDSPKIYIVKKNDEINWNRVLLAKDSRPEKVEQSSRPIKIPGFIKRSKLNLKLEGLQVSLDLGLFQKSNVNVSKILVKNLNLKASTAFEINSDLNYQFEKEKFLRTKVQVIGEIFLRDLIEENKINLISSFRIKETSLDSFLWRFPDLKGTLKTNGAKDNFESAVELRGGGLAGLNLVLNYTENILQLEKINLKVNIKDSLAHYQGFLPEIVRRTNFSKSVVTVEGDIAYDLKHSKVNPQLDFSIQSPFITNFYGLPKVETTMTGKISPSDWKLNLAAMVLGGKINVKLNALAELANYSKPITMWPKTDVLINLDGLSVTKNYIQKLLWSPDDTEEKVEKLTKKDKVEAMGALPAIDIKILGKRLAIGDRKSSLSGEVQVKGYLVESKKFIFRYDRGKIENKLSLLLDINRNMQLKLNSELKNIDLESFNPFFPPVISEVSGSFSGKNYLSINTKTANKFSIKSTMSARNGQIKNLNLNQFAEPVIEQLRQFKVKIPPNMSFSERFNSLKFDFIGNEKKIKINSFRLVSATKKERIFLKGDLSLGNSASNLLGTFYSSDISRQLYKNFGFSNLPIRLTGLGYHLLPDSKYTLDKIGAGANKKINKKIQKELVKQKKKVRRKIKKRIKSESKKIEDQVRSKIKGLKL